MKSARYMLAATSASSPAPTACAVRPVVPIRKKPKAQNSIAKMVEPRATPPMSAGSLSWPMTAVSAIPTSGTVAFDRIIGIAMARTSRLRSRFDCGLCSHKGADLRACGLLFPVSTRRRGLGSLRPAIGAKKAEEAHQEPKRKNNKGTENDVLARSPYRVEAERRDPISEPDDGVIEIVGIEAEERKNDPDNQRSGRELQNHEEWATAENAFHDQVRFLGYPTDNRRLTNRKEENCWRCDKC